MSDNGSYEKSLFYVSMIDSWQVFKKGEKDGTNECAQWAWNQSKVHFHWTSGKKIELKWKSICHCLCSSILGSLLFVFSVLCQS